MPQIQMQAVAQAGTGLAPKQPGGPTTWIKMPQVCVPLGPCTHSPEEVFRSAKSLIPGR